MPYKMFPKKHFKNWKIWTKVVFFFALNVYTTHYCNLKGAVAVVPEVVPGCGHVNGTISHVSRHGGYG